MHIHIRTSVPGIQKLPSPLDVCFLSFFLSSGSALRCRVCPRRRRGRRRGRGRGRGGRRGGSGEGIGNRRAIRETQRKDSITSYKESKPSGEINKQPWLLALRSRRRRRRGSRGNEERLCVGREKNGRMILRAATIFSSVYRLPFFEQSVLTISSFLLSPSPPLRGFRAFRDLNSPDRPWRTQGDGAGRDNVEV